MKKYEVTLSIGLKTFCFNVDSDQEAIEYACEEYIERDMEIIHVNRPEKDNLDRTDLYALEDILNYILDHAKEEQDCTDEEKYFLADCLNLRESTQKWLRKGKNRII